MERCPTPREPLTIRCLLTEQELAAELVAAFRSGSLPEKFFYWSPLSVRAWLDLCSDGAYRNYMRSRSLVELHADSVAAAVARPRRLPLQLVGIGAGQGDKDRFILRALGDHELDVSYLAIDSSQSLLEISVSQAAEAGLRAVGVKMDLTRGEHWRALAVDLPDSSRIFTLLGNTMGAFDPALLLERIAECARPGDLLLVDGEIHAPDTIGGYDNPLNRRFAFGPLTSVGIADQDGRLVFEDIAEPHGLWRLAKHFEPARALTIRLGGEPIRMESGTKLQMSFSLKYSAGTIETLVERAGFTIDARVETDDGRFVLISARRHD